MPDLLRQNYVRLAVVTLGAMDCQKKIAQKSHFVGAHCILALKANHEIHHGEGGALFADPEALEYGKTKGRIFAHHDPSKQEAMSESSTASSKSQTTSTG